MMIPHSLNADLLAERYRSRVINLLERRVLIARLNDSREGTDDYTLINCDGYGRIREFTQYKLYLERTVFPDRPMRPNFRGYPPATMVRTQVFQLAACNWRCWYCFVDDNRLSASPSTAKYLSAPELLALYMSTQDRPDIIDLSGGQPDLAPEWTLWMIDECARRGLLGHVYFWIDDNLSNDFLFKFLSEYEIARMVSIPNLSRMGCFKGFDEESFSFTTLAEPSHFDRQFETAKRIISAGFRFYAYATFTASHLRGVEAKMRAFVDRLQSAHELLPLWTTPLKIHNFAVTRTRLDRERSDSMVNQFTAFKIWDEELARRFPGKLRNLRPDQIT
jgi:uncharacterized Fe-S cluster-containing radical SAM superfamily protein